MNKKTIKNVFKWIGIVLAALFSSFVVSVVVYSDDTDKSLALFGYLLLFWIAVMITIIIINKKKRSTNITNQIDKSKGQPNYTQMDNIASVANQQSPTNTMQSYPTKDAYIGGNSKGYYNARTVGGLPVPSGTKCTIYLSIDNIECRVNGTGFKINSQKIVSIAIGKSKEIQKVAVSSSGGALAGGLMFGVLGAAYGGRAKTKDITTNKVYFSVIYNSESGEIKSLILEPDPFSLPSLKRAVKQYNNATSFGDNGSIEL